MLPTNTRTEFLDALGKFTSLVTDPAEAKLMGTDWTRFVAPDPLAVALPRSTREVAEILRCASAYAVPVVPSGGRTGLSGGAVAAKRELVLSLTRMNKMQAVDTVSRTVRAEAGVVNQALQQHCAPHGLFWPVELGSKGSCAIGGNIATNAGGVRVIRYGHTRQWVQSLQVVLASGEILELNGDLEKNNAGYDLRQLVIGSEGTLGVITEATLKLSALARESDVLFLAVSDMSAVLRILGEARALPLLAFECLTSACLEAVCAHRRWTAPLAARTPYYLLIEVEKSDEAARRALENWLESLFRGSDVTDGTLAQGPAEARKLWEFREGITESLAAQGLVYKNDLALPIRELKAFTDSLLREAPGWYPGCALYFFGHIGDGNLHVNVVKPVAMAADAFLDLCERRNEDVFALTQRHGGSIAAEHGIGLLKKRFLRFTRSPTEIALFRAVKKAFDPGNILNPGKIFDETDPMKQGEI